MLQYPPFSFLPSSERFRWRSSASPRLFLTRPKSQALDTHAHTHARTHPQTGANFCAEKCGVVCCGGVCVCDCGSVCACGSVCVCGGVGGMLDLSGLCRCLALIKHSSRSFPPSAVTEPRASDPVVSAFFIL